MATQTERRAKTRKAILDAAEALIQKHGYDRTSVDDIAERARVAKGTFYQHFDTKLDVLLELNRRQQDAHMKSVVSALDGGQPPLEVGREYVRGIALWCREQGAIAGELVLRALERPNETQQSSARLLLARILEAAQKRKEIRDDVSAEIMAILIAGSLVPPIVYLSRHPKKGDIVERLEQAWMLMLEGVLPRREVRR